MSGRIVRVLDRIAQAFTWVACVFCFVMMVHVSIDVTGRTFFNRPLAGTLEIVSAYYMVVLAFMPLAWLTRLKGHIIVELFTARLSLKNLLRLEVLMGLASLAYLALFIWQAIVMAVEKTEIGESWESATGIIPVWQSRWVLVAGIAYMTVFVALQLVIDYLKLRRRERPDLAAIGTPGAPE